VAKPVTLARLADDLHLLLHHYDLQAPLLVGHSMGALTIWQYLLQHGGSGLGGLCLIDQSPCPITDMHWQNGLYGDFDEAAAESFSRELTRDFAGSVLRFLGYDHEGSVAGDAELEAESMALLSEYLGALDATALTTCWESLIRADFRDLLPSIDLPTLLVSGNRSRFYGPKVAHYLHQQIQDSVLKIYREADHSPQLTCPDLLVRDLLAFLDALGGDPVR
jgi:pimeloyl-ACP methyl ester carboxylesterase